MTTRERPPRRRPGELAFSFVLLAFSAAALWQAYGISGLTSLVSAGVFPMVAAGAMLLAALVIAASGLRAAPSLASARFFADVLPPRHLLFLGLLAGYVSSLPWLGFVLASAVFLFASIALLWRRGPLPALVVSVAALGVVYLLFRVLFEVVLPKGSLFA